MELVNKMMFSAVEKCETGYSPLDLRGSHLGEESDSDINVDSDDEIIHVSSSHSGKFNNFKVRNVRIV